MPIGSGWDVPSDVKDRVEFHWFHVPVTGSLVLGVLSPAPTWYVGHFDGKRMQECTGKGCDLCTKGMGTQLRYVVSCVDISTHQVGVFEFGASVSMLIQQWSSGLGYLRGLTIEIGRASKSKHSRMEVKLIREAPLAWVLATNPLDLIEVLERTWERAEK
jgi:hypothetical protein